MKLQFSIFKAVLSLESWFLVFLCKLIFGACKFLVLRTRQALSLSYGRFFAEFLEDLSLVRLALLELITCVGFGTV
jgi:hypothetical protein